MRAMVDEFNAAQKNIKVESNTLGWSDFYQRIVAAVHAGQGPDVAVMQLDNLATQAARSVIVPMEDAIEQMGFTPEDFPQTLVEATTFNGHAWGIPLDSHTIASYANTDQLAAAGVEAQESTGPAFESELAAVQESGVDRAVLDAEPVAGPFDVPQPALAGRGRALLGGRVEGDVQQSGGRCGSHLDGRPGEERREPDERGDRLAVPGVQER